MYSGQGGLSVPVVTLPSALDVLFVIVVAAAVAIYVLRGMGILSFVPGGLLLLLLFLAVITGVAWILQKTR